MPDMKYGQVHLTDVMMLFEILFFTCFPYFLNDAYVLFQK